MTLRPISLVLSTGAARGIAFIGVIEELERQGFRISSIAGCSMGALIGAAYASGNLEKCKAELFKLNKRKILGLLDFSFSGGGLIKGRRIMELLQTIIPDTNIENLPIPYTAVATDIVNETDVAFERGSLHQAIRASISLPVIFRPVEWEGKTLADGGLINPLPLDRAKRTEGDILVGVVAGTKRNGADKINKSIFSMLPKTTSLMVQQNIRLSIEKNRPDLVIYVPGGEYSVMGFDKAEELVELGREEAKRVIYPSK